MRKSEPTSTIKQQIPAWVHYLLVLGLFISGLIYEFFTVTAYAGLGVVVVLILLNLLAFLATFLFIWKNKSIRVLKSRVLMVVLIWGLILALNLVVYWRNLYQSLFVANTNIFIVFLVALLAYVLASAYNVFAMVKQLVMASLAGYVLGTLLAGVVLAANYLRVVNFPNLVSSKDIIVINLILLSTLGVCLLPRLFVIYERRKNKLAISGLLAVSVIIASFLGNLSTLIFLIACALVATLLHFKKRVFTFHLVVISCVVLLSVVLRSMDAFSVKLSKLDLSATGPIASTQVVLSSLQNTNPIWGQGARHYSETYRQFEPMNSSLEFTGDKQFAASQLWEITTSYGLFGLVATIFALGVILRKTKTLSTKFNTAPITISYVQIVLAVLCVGLVMFHVETHYWVVAVPALVILANMTASTYWRFEKSKLFLLNSFVGIGLVGLVVYFLFSIFAFSANQVYGFAYQRLHVGNLASEQVTLDRIELASQLDPYQVRYQLDLSPIYTTIFINSLPKDTTSENYAQYQTAIEQLTKFADRVTTLDNDNYQVWENKLSVLINLGRIFPQVLNQDNKAAEALANIITLQPVNGTKLLQLADYVSDFNSVLPQQLAKIAYQNNSNVDAAALNYARLLIADDNLPEARKVLARIVTVSGLAPTSLAEARNLLESIK